MPTKRRRKKKARERRPYQAHGLTAIFRGGTARDLGRLQPFKGAEEWVVAIVAQLGGRLTPTTATKIRLAEKKLQRLGVAYEFIDTRLVSEGGRALINTKRKMPYALASWVDAAEDSVVRLLRELEGAAVKAPVPELGAYLEETYGRKRTPRTRKPKALTLAQEHQAEHQAETDTPHQEPVHGDAPDPE
jgi:hypothetical protein